MRPTVLIALGAAIVALAAAAAPAAADVNPAPLWHAYPLHSRAPAAGPSTNGQGVETTVTRPHGQRAAARRSPVPGADRGHSALLAVGVGGLAGAALALAWVLVVAARGSLSRRLERGREARRRGAAAIPPTRGPVALLTPPPTEPEECVIVWHARGVEAQFRAVGRNRTGRRYVAARSPAVADPRPPLRYGETLEAWEALVGRLEKQGWMAHGPAPNGNGTPWYAQRFERPRRPARSPARATGDRA